jgi:hypothetical protein
VRQAEGIVRTTGEPRSGGAVAGRAAALLALACLALVAQGCREDEQNRPLAFDKGTYLGPVDQKLGEEQVDALRQRAAQHQI